MIKTYKLGKITLSLLAAQYGLGMLTALFGGEEGKRTIFAHTVFGLHVLLALIVTSYSAIFYKHIKSMDDSLMTKVAGIANTATIASFVSGVATVSLHGMWEELASLSMALSFLIAFAGYGYLYLSNRKLILKQA